MTTSKDIKCLYINKTRAQRSKVNLYTVKYSVLPGEVSWETMRTEEGAVSQEHMKLIFLWQ